MNRRRFDSRNECAVPTFGRPMANNGWVQCRSKTFPGKSYYFNVDSRCRTWGRPVSSHVTVPFVDPTKPNFQSDVYLDNELDEVSDIEEEEEEDDSLQICVKRRKIFDEILFKLYHCEPDDGIADVTSIEDESFACKTEFIKKEEEIKDEFSPILPEICYSSSSDGESVVDGFKKNRRRSKRSHGSRIVKNYYSRDCENRAKKSEIVYDRFSSLNSFGTKDSSDRRFCDHEATSNFSLFNYREGSLDCDEETEDEEDEGFEENIKMESEEINDDMKLEHTRFSLPRLKIIQFSDLITESTGLKNRLQKKAACKVKKIVTIPEEPVDSQPNKIKTFVHEINGVKTISYDFVAPELPPGVKASNLSDSGSSSFEIALSARDRDKAMEKDVKKIEPQSQRNSSFQNELFYAKDLCLSESSSSSSSSCSSDTSCSSSDSESSSSEDSGSSSDSESISSKDSESSSDSSSSSDCSCSSCSSSTSSSTSIESFSSKIKKEEDSDSGAILSLIKKENSIREFPKNSPDCQKIIKVQPISSPSSSSNSDKSWRLIDNSSDDDD